MSFKVRSDKHPGCVTPTFTISGTDGENVAEPITLVIEKAEQMTFDDLKAFLNIKVKNAMGTIVGALEDTPLASLMHHA